MDEVNPTGEELKVWACSDADEPYEDFDIVIAAPEYMNVIIDLIGDPACRRRKYLLGSLYCLVGHSDLADPGILAGVERAAESTDPWLRSWALRASKVLRDPASRKRDDWCGWQGLRSSPAATPLPGREPDRSISGGPPTGDNVA